MAKYSDVKPGKDMDLAFEDELLEDDFMSEEMDKTSDIEEALAPFSKEEIEAYLEGMDEEENMEEDMESEEDMDEFSKADKSQPLAGIN